MSRRRFSTKESGTVSGYHHCIAHRRHAEFALTEAVKNQKWCRQGRRCCTIATLWRFLRLTPYGRVAVAAGDGSPASAMRRFPRRAYPHSFGDASPVSSDASPPHRTTFRASGPFVSILTFTDTKASMAHLTVLASRRGEALRLAPSVSMSASQRRTMTHRRARRRRRRWAGTRSAELRSPERSR